MQFNDVTRNVVVAMPGVTIFSKENYGDKDASFHEGGWTDYLRSLRRPVSPKGGGAAGGPMPDGSAPVLAYDGPGLDLPLDAPDLALSKESAAPSTEEPATKPKE